MADRFHLMQNLRQAIEQLLSRDHRAAQKVQSKAAPQAAPETPGADDVPQHQQMVRQGRRGVWLDRFDQVKALQGAGRNLNAIIEQTGLNWRTVAKWLEADALPERPPRDPKSTNPVKFESFLAQRWNAGIRTGRPLLTEIRALGYAGSLSDLQRLLRQWRGTGSTALVQRPRVNDTLIVPAPRIVPPIAASIRCIKPRGQRSAECMAVPALNCPAQARCRWRNDQHGHRGRADFPQQNGRFLESRAISCSATRAKIARGVTAPTDLRSYPYRADASTRGGDAAA